MNMKISFDEDNRIIGDALNDRILQLHGIDYKNIDPKEKIIELMTLKSEANEILAGNRTKKVILDSLLDHPSMRQSKKKRKLIKMMRTREFLSHKELIRAYAKGVNIKSIISDTNEYIKGLNFQYSIYFYSRKKIIRLKISLR